ncbi:MAG: protein phosphatase 2C domain-containing protein [Acidobacteria bacterium]|nr:protein phosphatase 2C domain-containing protein [Acidobacteriota bacterium]
MPVDLARRAETAAGAGGRLRAAGRTDVGRQRTVNEDRLHVDTARGVFVVVDGVGGQAAGGRAADIAISMLRDRLERQTGAPADRVREAITIANNEIFHEAQQRPEWHGMACVLTVALVERGRLVVGHVGDTRLYMVRGGEARKLTPDHSPVGEREDARELSELEAMRHPRRNEVFRDVGSTVHHLADRDFVHVAEFDFPDDAALLVCSDGLTDLVPLETIRQVVQTRKGTPENVVEALVGAANDAGGKDNVTVVYVEGEQFAGAAVAPRAAVTSQPGYSHRSRAPLGWMAAITLIAVVVGGWWMWDSGWRLVGPASSPMAPPVTGAIVVRPNESIAAAIEQAQPGFSVIVEPGEYRERLTLKNNVRIISRVPRGATLRLPDDAASADAAVVAAGISGAEVSGFRIVGDETAPLGVGIIVRDASVRLVDLEVTGATTAAIALGGGDDVTLVGNEIHDNPGAALVLGPDSAPRISHNSFARNATADRAASPFVMEAGALPVFSRNVFHGIDARALAAFDAPGHASMAGDNWFLDIRPAARSGPRAVPPAPRSR